MWPFANSRQPRHERHDPRELVAKGALLLDVRTPEEFRAHCIPGAVNIPLQDLDQRLHEVGPKTRPVVVHCRSGARSARAAQLLAREGYEVHDIGGIGNW